MGLIEFTDNHEDLSTDKGFQFKFFCERCQNGFMSTYKINKLGTASGLLGAAGRLLGGVLDRAADSAYEVQQAVGGPAHDAALKEAVEEAKVHFHQCERCGQWVCPERCWNEERTMCKDCAPDFGEELAAAQQEEMLSQMREKVRETDLIGELDVTSTATGKCPNCGAKSTGGKFCPECGKPYAPEIECPKCGAKAKAGAKFCLECGQSLVVLTACPKCGAKLEPGAKFCAECGEKLGG